MIGTGRAAVSEVAEISRANIHDGVAHEAIRGLGSLGGFGKHKSNEERDLHRWVQGLHNMSLTPFEVSMTLNVTWIQIVYVECHGLENWYQNNNMI